MLLQSAVKQPSVLRDHTRTALKFRYASRPAHKLVSSAQRNTITCSATNSSGSDDWEDWADAPDTPIVRQPSEIFPKDANNDDWRSEVACLAQSLRSEAVGGCYCFAVETFI